MLGPAAFAIALGAHSFSFRVTIRPEAGPAPAAAAVHHKLLDPSTLKEITAKEAGEFVLRTAVRIIAGHAPVSPSIAGYAGYAVKPSLKDFRLPAEPVDLIRQPEESRSGTVCLQQSNTAIASRICGH